MIWCMDKNSAFKEIFEQCGRKFQLLNESFSIFIM